MDLGSQHSGTLLLIAFFNSLGKSIRVEQRVHKINRAIGDKWLIAEGLKTGDRLRPPI
jgi:hypothetical protein